MFDYNDVGVDMGMDVWVCPVIKVLPVDRRIWSRLQAIWKK
jgi:hypothetical protein